MILVPHQVQVTINADIDTINSIQAVIKFEVPELGLAQIGRLNITAKNSTINGLNEVSIEHVKKIMSFSKKNLHI